MSTLMRRPMAAVDPSVVDGCFSVAFARGKRTNWRFPNSFRFRYGIADVEHGRHNRAGFGLVDFVVFNAELGAALKRQNRPLPNVCPGSSPFPLPEIPLPRKAQHGRLLGSDFCVGVVYQALCLRQTRPHRSANRKRHQGSQLNI